MAIVSNIWLYPIKSLDGISVSQAQILPSGALKGDREFAIIDAEERYINAKRTASIHSIRACFDLDARTVSLGVQDSSERQLLHLDGERSLLDKWFSDYFHHPVRLISDSELGFPDDKKRPGPTIVAERSLSAVADWYPELSTENIRRRFRANIEIGDVPAFWEDCLIAPDSTPIPFRIGNVQLDGLNPCERCIVPTRDPASGESYLHFQRIFSMQRQSTNPRWAQNYRFKHFYRLSTNTRLSSSHWGGTIAKQDDIVLFS